MMNKLMVRQICFEYVCSLVKLKVFFFYTCKEKGVSAGIKRHKKIWTSRQKYSNGSRLRDWADLATILFFL